MVKNKLNEKSYCSIEEVEQDFFPQKYKQKISLSQKVNLVPNNLGIDAIDSCMKELNNSLKNRR